MQACALTLLLALGGESRPVPASTVPRLPPGVPAPVIDGRLDDPAWDHAGPLGALTQVEPIAGAQPSERTEVGLLLDSQALYVRLLCLDREPDRIRASQMQRDADLDPDDRVEILIDPFLDRRNAFWFQVGAGGSMGDALITKNGSSFNKQWDGIWLGRARVTSRGWEAEMRIPVATLNFDPAGTRWGFNLRRLIRRHTEEARWASPFNRVRFFSVADAGTLEGIGGLEKGMGLDLTPFAVVDAGRDHELEESETSGDVGLDAVWRITPDTKLTLSYNTDFAEAEVDARRVNLTRFPLLFPEKRKFFLEDAGAFFFGYGDREVNPFFSRRIGLDPNGEIVPLYGAAKLTAQTEDWSLGLLGAATEATDSVEESQLATARYSYNLLERSDVGLIWTHGDPSGTGTADTLGVDLNLRTADFLGDRNLAWSVWGLRSESSEDGGDGNAFSTLLDYPNDIVDLSASATYVDEDFDPKLGFVRRRGVKRYEADLRWRPRLNDGTFRRLDFQLEPTLVTDLGNELETAEVELQPFGFELESGDRAGLELRWTEDVLETDFDITDDVTIPAGDYPWVRGGLFLRSSEKRPLSLELRLSAGGFYDGQRSDLGLELEWRALRYVQFDAEYERNDVSLPGGDFVVNVGRLGLGLFANPDLSWTQFLQYDDVSEELGLNSRVRWILRPGSESFLVLNQGWDASDDGLVATSTELTFKVGVTLRF